MLEYELSLLHKSHKQYRKTDYASVFFFLVFMLYYQKKYFLSVYFFSFSSSNCYSNFELFCNIRIKSFAKNCFIFHIFTNKLQF